MKLENRLQEEFIIDQYLDGNITEYDIDAVEEMFKSLKKDYELGVRNTSFEKWICDNINIVDESDYEDDIDAEIDNLYGIHEIAGSELTSSYILKMCDPTLYNILVKDSWDCIIENNRDEFYRIGGYAYLWEDIEDKMESFVPDGYYHIKGTFLNNSKMDVIFPKDEVDELLETEFQEWLEEREN
jgi:hypothetical protein